MANSKRNRWVSKVKTDSTHPPAGLFTQKASTIARSLASKRVSPKGPASGMHMLAYFINRAGQGFERSPQGRVGKGQGAAFKAHPKRENGVRWEAAAA
jgi:hypothetical protein